MSFWFPVDAVPQKWMHAHISVVQWLLSFFFFFSGGFSTKNGLPPKGFPVSSRVTEQLRYGRNILVARARPEASRRLHAFFGTLAGQDRITLQDLAEEEDDGVGPVHQAAGLSILLFPGAAGGVFFHHGVPS